MGKTQQRGWESTLVFAGRARQQCYLAPLLVAQLVGLRKTPGNATKECVGCVLAHSQCRAKPDLHDATRTAVLTDAVDASLGNTDLPQKLIPRLRRRRLLEPVLERRRRRRGRLLLRLQDRHDVGEGLLGPRLARRVVG